MSSFLSSLQSAATGLAGTVAGAVGEVQASFERERLAMEAKQRADDQALEKARAEAAAEAAAAPLDEHQHEDEPRPGGELTELTAPRAGSLASAVAGLTSTVAETAKRTHLSFTAALDTNNAAAAAAAATQNTNEGVAWPWVTDDGVTHAGLRQTILALSDHVQTFLEPPPDDAGFVFDMAKQAGIVVELLEIDPGLAEMRRKLVRRRTTSKTTTDEHFWRNYWYRVGLARKAFVDGGGDGGDRGGGVGGGGGGGGAEPLSLESDAEDDVEFDASSSAAAATTAPPPPAVAEDEADDADELERQIAEAAGLDLDGEESDLGSKLDGDALDDDDLDAMVAAELDADAGGERQEDWVELASVSSSSSRT